MHSAFSVVFVVDGVHRDVIPDITILGHLFVFGQSCVV